MDDLGFDVEDAAKHLLFDQKEDAPDQGYAAANEDDGRLMRGGKPQLQDFLVPGNDPVDGFGPGEGL